MEPGQLVRQAIVGAIPGVLLLPIQRNSNQTRKRRIDSKTVIAMRIPPTVVDLAARAATAASALDVTGNALISVPSEVPPFAKLMDPAFASFSLEFQYWPVYAGNATGSPNQYMNQLLRNLEVRTGQTPAIRVGGKFATRHSTI